jgi:hypothetical protein
MSKGITKFIVYEISVEEAKKNMPGILSLSCMI